MHLVYVFTITVQLRLTSAESANRPSSQSFQFCVITLTASSGKRNVSVWRLRSPEEDIVVFLFRSLELLF